jgi:hypothetical protein
MGTMLRVRVFHHIRTLKIASLEESLWFWKAATRTLYWEAILNKSEPAEYVLRKTLGHSSTTRTLDSGLPELAQK